MRTTNVSLSLLLVVWVFVTISLLTAMKSTVLCVRFLCSIVQIFHEHPKWVVKAYTIQSYPNRIVSAR